MTRWILRHVICRVIGHSKEKTPMVFFRTWNGLTEIGSLHCVRCGQMVGEYRNDSVPLMDPAEGTAQSL